MGRTDYKAKYDNLKLKFQSTTDLAWRLGYEQGLRDAQTEQATMAAQQANELEQNAGEAQVEGENSPEAQAPKAENAPISENPNGDELNQHIEKLESMLGKTELASSDLGDLKKTLNDIRSLQVQINLTKSMESAKNVKMGKWNAPLVITPKLNTNMPEQAKKALSLQEKIIGDIFKKWDTDTTQTSKDITSILKGDGLVKKE